MDTITLISFNDLHGGRLRALEEQQREPRDLREGEARDHEAGPARVLHHNSTT